MTVMVRAKLPKKYICSLMFSRFRLSANYYAAFDSSANCRQRGTTPTLASRHHLCHYRSIAREKRGAAPTIREQGWHYIQPTTTK